MFISCAHTLVLWLIVNCCILQHSRRNTEFRLVLHHNCLDELCQQCFSAIGQKVSLKLIDHCDQSVAFRLEILTPVGSTGGCGGHRSLSSVLSLAACKWRENILWVYLVALFTRTHT